MAEYQRHEHDVLIIGAGGAGLRAAVEASGAGVSVGLVCKSLLGPFTSLIPCAVVVTSITGGWRSYMLEKRQTGFGN